MFLRDFANSGHRKATTVPVYTLLHVLTPHLAVATDADCNIPDSSHAPRPGGVYANQARCALLSGPRHYSIDFEPSTSTTEAPSLSPRTMEWSLTWIEPEDQHPMARNANTGQVSPSPEVEVFRHASAPG